MGSKDAKHLVELAKDNYVKEEFVSSEWIKLRNLTGEYHFPKEDLVNDVKTMDELFREFHHNAPGLYAPNDLKRDPNVIRDYLEILKDHFSDKYPLKMLRRFARTRTFFRQRHIQKQFQRIESSRSKKTKIEYGYY